MPKYRLRKSGENIRVNKGKCASEINFDISEQCVDDKVQDCDEEIQTKTDEEASKVDTRTFDEIMLDAFEECNSKMSRLRLSALTSIATQLQLTHNPAFLTEHMDRILSIIENAMQSEIPCEIDAAASIISLVAIQLPDCNMNVFYAPLKASLENKNLRSSVLSAVCNAMGTLTFMNETNNNQILAVMEVLEDYFVYDCNYISPNEALRNTQFPNYEFQKTALETWTFLMTLLPSHTDGFKTLTLSSKSVESVLSLFDSRCFNKRVASARAIAVLLECGLAKKYLESNLTRIIQKVSWISNTRGKSLSEIKSTSDVLKYIEKGITPSREIRNGKCVLDLNSWALNVRYEMLCNVIGSANVAKHLCQNKKLLKKLKMGQSMKGSTFSPKTEDAPSCEPVNNRSITGQSQQKEDEFINILKNLQLATQKSPIERTKALKAICDELQDKLVPHTFLADQKNVILEIIFKAMKRGSESEQLAAVRLATLTVLQFGRDERFCSEISKLFFNSLKQSSATISTNASICTALALIELVDDEYSTNVSFESVMNVLKQIFYESHPRYKSSKEDSSNEQSNLLRIKALEAWALLLTLCSPKDVCSIVKSQMIKDLTEMLHSSNAEFRIVCGQVISLIIEQGRMHDSGYLKSDIPEICNVIQDLVTDRRSISRDKRMKQNTNLREVLKYLEDGSHSPFLLRFFEEIHELKTWSSLFRYQKLSQFMGSSLAIHLSQNQQIRNIIPIVGPRPVITIYDRPPNVIHKLSSALKKKSKSKTTSKFDQSLQG